MSIEHDELAEDLAAAIGLMPFMNVPLGSVYLSNWGEAPARADVVGIKPSYNRFCLSVYEVKVSRADFLSDIRSEKWKSYLPHCNRFYFAMPQGIATREEIPDPAGLYVKGPKGWSAIKGAQKIDVEIPTETLKALIFSKTRLPARMRRRAEINQNLQVSAYRETRERRKLLGKKIDDALRNYEYYELRRNDLEYKLKNIEELLKEFAEVVGSEYPWIWQIRERIKLIREETGLVKGDDQTARTYESLNTL